jgi:DoxX-like family
METTTTIHVSPSDARTAPISKGRLWTGRIMSALPALFLLADGVGKLVKPAPVVQGTVQLGYPESVLVGLGIVLLSCTVLYGIIQMTACKLPSRAETAASHQGGNRT